MAKLTLTIDLDKLAVIEGLNPTRPGELGPAISATFGQISQSIYHMDVATGGFRICAPSAAQHDDTAPVVGKVTITT